MNEENRYFILDAQNGELVRGLGNDLDNIINTSFKGTRIEGIREFKKTEYRYIKINPFVLDKLVDEAPFTFKIIKYISYKENSLMFPNGKYINQSNLAEDLGLSREHICRKFRDLREKNIINTIKKDGKVIYLLNPYIATRGSDIYIEVFDKFIKTEWEKLAVEKGKKK